MLLKISLILAILVGAATLFFTGNVKTKLDTVTGERDQAVQAQQAAQDAQRKAQDEAKKSKAAYETASKDLNTATNMVRDLSNDLNVQKKRADKASADLVTATEERNQARQELNRWTALGIPVENVREALETNRRLTAERTAMMTENKAFSRRVTELTARLRRYEGEPSEPPLAAGIKGKIVAVDPKYDFVVLDIGANQGLVQDASMLVNRDGRLVARVKITRVEPNRAIANIMPEWKQDDVLEGDQVVVQ
jgi:hypothetical protein